MQNLIIEIVSGVIGSLIHNWLPLSLAILTAACLTVYLNPEKLRQSLLRRSAVSIPASVAFGAFTPLCACGTMAVIIAMLTTTLPWGPIMAFLTSSPLMSPDGFILVAGIISMKFAIALAVASVVIGLVSGYATHCIEKRTDFLKNQVRIQKTEKPQPQTVRQTPERIAVMKPVLSCACSDTEMSRGTPCCPTEQLCCAAPADFGGRSLFFDTTEFFVAEHLFERTTDLIRQWKLQKVWKAVVNIGFKQIILYYSIFVGIGLLINKLIPASIITGLFSGSSIFSVPIAAFIGLPLYMNGESALPLIKSLMDSGAGGGAMLAFLITGPGTSAGVIAGISTIMKRRAITLYVLFLLVGGIVLGYLYDILLAAGI